MKFYNNRRKRSRKFALGRNALGICERSGQKCLQRDMVIEPGTGLMVHKAWSDGKWNRVDNPQNFSSDVSEAISLQNVTGDEEVSAPGLRLSQTEDGIFELDSNGQPFFVSVV
jgi:hypothetical protein